MNISPLSNEEFGGLMKELQGFWSKWRDSATNDDYSWSHIIGDANMIYRKYGDASADLIGAFIKQIEYRIVPQPEEDNEKDYTH